MSGKHILIVTDAWYPQVNGVVRATATLKDLLEKRGFRVSLIEPSQFRTMALPSYPEIRLALFPRKRTKQLIEELAPDAIHIATEGPLGYAASRYCAKNGIPFTSAYHTHFLDYTKLYIGSFAEPLARAFLRRVHGRSRAVMVSTSSLRDFLCGVGLTENVAVVPLGVDTKRFVRGATPEGAAYTSPVFIYVGRLSKDKNVEDFLRLDLPGTKLVVGDGPEGERLRREYGTSAVFLGYLHGQNLVNVYSKADVFVFPSRTETFGLVALEALACGVPVAAPNVMGQRDIITNGVDGYIDDDLRAAALKCLTLSREDCRKTALKYSWENHADAFLAPLAWIS